MALMEHNIPIYNEIVDSYKDNKNVILVHATGLGKSFIFFELLNSIFKDKRVLFVIPKKDIKDAMSLYDEYKLNKEFITFTCYNQFSNYKMDYNKKWLKSFDAIVFDEVHHIGSPQYGKNARKLCFKNKKLQVLGLTATNKREDYQDVADYFDKTVSGYNLFEAILDGLAPKFEYYICKDVDGLTIMENKIENTLKKLDIYNSIPLLKKLVAKNKHINKWICFFKTIEECDNSIPTIKKIFRGYKVLVITSKHDNTIDMVNNTDKVVVLSVNKLIEGIHVKGIGGIVYFRNISSTIVFKQTLGRIINLNNDNSIIPICIDCTGAALKFLSKINGEIEEAIAKKNEKLKEGGIKYTRSNIIYRNVINSEEFDLVEKYLNAINKQNNDYAKAIEMAKEGYTLKEISEATGIIYITLRAYFNNNNIPYKKKIQKRHEYSKAIEMAKEGYTLKEISEVTGIGISILRAYFDNNNIPYKKKIYKRNDYSKAIEMAKEGYTLKEISEVTGIDFNSLKSYFNYNNIPYKKRSQNDYSKAIEMAKEGYTLKEISKETGIKIGTLESYFNRNNISYKKRRNK